MNSRIQNRVGMGSWPGLRLRGTAKFAAVCAVISIAAGNDAHADSWLNARRDPQRSAASVGRARLDQPTVAWRRYLGGALGPDDVLVDDIDGDSSPDIAMLIGGRVILRHADDSIVWETSAIGASAFVGLSDLDGDAARELVVSASGNAVIVIDGRTGRERWRLPAGDFGNIGHVRILDIDGDGRADLYVQACRCCSLPDPTPGRAYAFSAAGASLTHRVLWSLPATPGPQCGVNDAIGDVDGDGVPELVTVTEDSVVVYDARPSGPLATVQATLTVGAGVFYYGNHVELRNIDADPGLEMLIGSDGYLIAGMRGSRRVAMYDYRSGASARIVEAWEMRTTPDRGRVWLATDSVADFDGDSRADVAFGLFDGTRWSTIVRDAANATATPAILDGVEPTGIVDVNGDGRAEVLGLASDERSLAAYQLRGGALVPLWTIAASVRPIHATDFARQEREAFDERPMTWSACGRSSIMLQPFDAALPREERRWELMDAYDLGVSPPRRVARFTPESGSSISAAIVGPRLTRDYPQPLVATTGGFLEILDCDLRSTNHFESVEITYPGMRVGGYYTGAVGIGRTPVIGELGGAPSVVVSDSRPALVRIDARNASLDVPVRQRWERARAQYPLLTDLDGTDSGRNELVVVNGRSVSVLDAMTGTDGRWTSEIDGPRGSLQYVHRDVLAAARAGRPGHDVFFPRMEPGGIYQSIALRGTDGMLLWPAADRRRTLTADYVVSWSIADLDRDGSDDYVAVANTVVGFGGAQLGTVLAGFESDAGLPYGMPLVADFTGDGRPDVYFHGDHFEGRLLVNGESWATPRMRTDNTAPQPDSLGTVVTCAGQPAVVQGSYLSPELWTVRPQEFPAATAVRAHVALAGGNVYGSRTAIPATVVSGSLGNATSIADLDGGGHPAVLIGSTDGYLYALNPCDLTLRWAMNFRYPVGEPVIGDTDGDGTDEVLVSVADGYLYALARQAYPAPTDVWDTDPPSMIENRDVDEIETVNRLFAQWSAVPGATAYLVTVRTGGTPGSPVRFPEYVRTTETRLAIGELPLRLGSRYVLGVRAVGPNGTGAETESDGVTLVDRASPEITLLLDRQAFAPGMAQTLGVDVTYRDRGGLTRTGLEIFSIEPITTLRRSVRVVDNSPHDPRIEYRRLPFMWDGTAGSGPGLPEGEYDVVATASDIAGRDFIRRATVRIVHDIGDAGADGGTGLHRGGCGCVTAGALDARGRSAAVAVLFAGALALARRKRGRVHRGGGGTIS